MREHVEVERGKRRRGAVRVGRERRGVVGSRPFTLKAQRLLSAMLSLSIQVRRGGSFCQLSIPRLPFKTYVRRLSRSAMPTKPCGNEHILKPVA